MSCRSVCTIEWDSGSPLPRKQYSKIQRECSNGSSGSRIAYNIQTSWHYEKTRDMQKTKEDHRINYLCHRQNTKYIKKIQCIESFGKEDTNGIQRQTHQNNSWFFDGNSKVRKAWKSVFQVWKVTTARLDYCMSWCKYIEKVCMKKSRLEQFMPLCLHHGRYWNESFEGKRMLNTSKKLQEKN